MSNGIKISQLVDAGSITQQDYLPVARGSDETYKIAAKQFVVNAITQGSGIPIVISKQDGAGQTLLFRSLSGVDGISIVNRGDTTVVSGSGQNPIKTVFTGTGSQVNFPFTLTNTSSRNVNNYRVDIDGVLQEPGQTADYYLNGPNLTFTSAPPLSSKIVVISNNLLPLAESVPPDNSVSTAKLSAGAVTTDKIALSAVTIDRLGADVRFSIVPTGAIMTFYRSTAPTGWLACDGSTIPEQFAALISLVGANTPNLQGQFIRGLTTNFSTTSRDPSATRVLGSIQEDAIENHTHTYSLAVNSAVYSHDGGAGALRTLATNTNTGGVASSLSAIETRPVNIALLYCIKT